MNAVQLSARGRPILVYPAGTSVRRIAAEVFALADRPGLAFADVGWADPFQSGHPFHVLEGELIGPDGGPWAVGAPPRRALLRMLGFKDPLWSSRQAWRRWRKSVDGRGATRELARQQIMQTFGLELRP